jgi:uncharacterized membrane protein YeaQ/YmgE (transglycosylase-associated protein family)
MHRAEKGCDPNVVLAAVMPPLGRIAAWLFAGLAVGGTARPLLGGAKGRIADAILGLIGGFVGGVGAILIMGSQASPWVSILTAVGGAISVVGIGDSLASPPV